MGALSLANPSHRPLTLLPAPGPGPARLPLTLVLDEAVSGQELQRMHLEQHTVEEEAVGRRPAGGVAG